MLVDVLSFQNYQSYNVPLANKIGLNNSIYLSVLIDLFQIASQNGATMDNNYFWVDREYVKSRTTFPIEEQLKIEETLLHMGFIYLSIDKKYIRLDLNMIIGISTTTNEDIMNCFDVVRQQANKGSKKESILRAVTRKINSNYPGNIQNALKDWLSTIADKYGYVNTAMIDNAQKILDNIIWTDLKRAEETIKIATLQAYRDMTWACTRYDELHKNDSVKTTIQTNNTHILSKDYF